MTIEQSDGPQARMQSRRWGHGLLLLLITLALLALVAWMGAQPVHAQRAAPAQARAAIISPALERAFAAQAGPQTFLLILDDQADVAGIAHAADARERRAAIYAALTAHAGHTQASLRAWLDARGVPYRPFYLVNMIAVTGDAALAEELRSLPGVNRLAANPAVAGADTVADPGAALPAGWEFSAAGADASAALPWGLAYSRAPDVWAQGVTGQGIVIGSQDTGVDWDHPALRDRYRGWDAAAQTAHHPYNWFDAWGVDGRADAGGDPRGSCTGAALNDAQIPCDDWGHGTHTAGTMLGDARALGDTLLGMAPDAQWIGCRNMRFNFGTPASYTACFEFLFAPFPQGGDPFTDGKPELGADIINNSWGCPPAEGCDAASLRQVVETARAAGQFVAASAGNTGSSCSSVSTPIALHDAAFSVGAFSSDGTVAGFSSRGPVAVDGSNRRKPDLSAPGVGVRSTGLGSDVTTSLSGTSMASPHVAGAVALLWSAVPALAGDVGLTEQVLFKSATPVLDAGCEVDGVARTPNNTYGFGRLDAAAALEVARAPGSLAVTVTTRDGAPVAGAAVRVADTVTGYVIEAVTGANGVAAFATIYGGLYEVQVSAPALYFPPAQVDVPAGEAASLSVVDADPTAEGETGEPHAPGRVFLPVVGR